MNVKQDLKSMTAAELLGVLDKLPGASPFVREMLKASIANDSAARRRAFDATNELEGARLAVQDAMLHNWTAPQIKKAIASHGPKVCATVGGAAC